MEIAVDLHAHSMFAGGSGALSLKPENFKASLIKAHKRFEIANKNSQLKGIQILGTGDIQFNPWLNFCKEFFIEKESGLFTYKDRDLHYCLQTEIIITASINKKQRKSAHVVILFPHYEAIDDFKVLLDKYEVKQDKLPRPFLKLDNNNQVSEVLFKIKEIDSLLEIIPAHIMTPEGVYGGNNGVNRLSGFFGDFEKEISIVETGLSADPEILSIIPELDKRTLLSNADAHSSQLHRIGREFTVVNANQFTYKSVIESLRQRKIAFTLEFPVSEGRYFLTGHRSNRKKPGTGHGKNQYCYYSPELIPAKNLCPICNAPLSKGVLQRVFEIGKHQGKERSLAGKNHEFNQNYLHGVPLVEVIASALNIKSPDAKSVLKPYFEIVSVFNNEVSLWKEDINKITSNFPKSVSNNILKAIIQVKNDNFCFSPPGFDGQYGSLVLGKSENYFGHSKIQI